MESSYRQRLDKIRPTSGVSIEFALSEPVTDARQFMVCAQDPFIFGMAPSNLWPGCAPKNRQLLTFGALSDRETVQKPDSCEFLFHSIREKANEMLPGLERKLLWERPLAFPVLDGVELTVDQNRKLRPTPRDTGIDGLYLSGDFLCAVGSGGDLAVASALECVKAIEEDLG